MIRWWHTPDCLWPGRSTISNWGTSWESAPEKIENEHKKTEIMTNSKEWHLLIADGAVINHVNEYTFISRLSDTSEYKKPDCANRKENSFGMGSFP